MSATSPILIDVLLPASLISPAFFTVTTASLRRDVIVLSSFTAVTVTYTLALPAFFAVTTFFSAVVWPTAAASPSTSHAAVRVASVISCPPSSTVAAASMAAVSLSIRVMASRSATFMISSSAPYTRIAASFTGTFVNSLPETFRSTVPPIVVPSCDTFLPVRTSPFSSATDVSATARCVSRTSAPSATTSTLVVSFTTRLCLNCSVTAGAVGSGASVTSGPVDAPGLFVSPGFCDSPGLFVSTGFSGASVTSGPVDAPGLFVSPGFCDSPGLFVSTGFSGALNSIDISLKFTPFVPSSPSSYGYVFDSSCTLIQSTSPTSSKSYPSNSAPSGPVSLMLYSAVYPPSTYARSFRYLRYRPSVYAVHPSPSSVELRVAFPPQSSGPFWISTSDLYLTVTLS